MLNILFNQDLCIYILLLTFTKDWENGKGLPVPAKRVLQF